MAIVAASNFSSPHQFSWCTTGEMAFDRDYVYKLAEDVDLHDHSSGKGLGVYRIQTGSAPAAAGQVQVTGDTFVWWGATAGATRTAVAIEGTQTISGTKTFSAALTASTSVITPLVRTSGATALGLGVNGATKWNIDTSGHLQDATGNTQDIGVSGHATSPRTGYFATSVVTPTVTATTFTGTSGSDTTIQGPSSSNHITIYGQNGLVKLKANGGAAYVFVENAGSGEVFAPSTDGTCRLGLSDHQWEDVWSLGAYNDYVFEQHFTGKLKKHKAWAEKNHYTGRKTLSQVKQHVQQHHQFEALGRPSKRNEPPEKMGMGERAGRVLEVLEEAYLHLFEIDERLKALGG